MKLCHFAVKWMGDGKTLEPLHQPYFCEGYFQEKILWNYLLQAGFEP
jgi:hypothetical protein